MKRMKATWLSLGIVLGFLLFIAASESEATDYWTETGETCVQKGRLEALVDTNGKLWLKIWPINVDGASTTCPGPCKLDDTIVFDEDRTPFNFYVSVTYEIPSGACGCTPRMTVNSNDWTSYGYGALCGGSGTECSPSGQIQYENFINAGDHTDNIKNWVESDYTEGEPLTLYIGTFGCGTRPFSACNSVDWCGWAYAQMWFEDNIYVEWYGQYTSVSAPPGGCSPRCYEISPPSRKAGDTVPWSRVKRLYS